MGYFDSSSDDDSSCSTSTYSSGAAGNAIAAAAYKNVNPTERDSFLMLPMARAGPTIGSAVKRQSLIQRLFGKGHDVTDEVNKAKADAAKQEQAPPKKEVEQAPSASNGTRRQSVFGRDTTTAKPKGSHVGRRMSTFTLGVKTGVKNLMLNVTTAGGGADNKKKKKGVRWSTGNMQAEEQPTKLIETLEELYEEGLSDKIWYNSDEMGNMKEEADLLAESMDSSSKSSSNSTVPTEVSMEDNDSEVDVEDELRGLEYRTEEGNWKSYKARQDATNAALDEQDRQEAASKFVPPNLEEIAIVVREVTEPYMMEAIQRGKRDAKVASIICQDTRDEIREMEESGRISCVSVRRE